MEIKNCIFTEEKDSVNQQIKVFYDDKVEFHTFNLDDPVVSDIVKNSGGVDQIESNTRKFIKNNEKEMAMYEKFKSHIKMSDDLTVFFKRKFDQEELFNLKIWLFEQPEIENCKNEELKTKLRSANNLIDIIGIFYNIKNQSN